MSLLLPSNIPRYPSSIYGYPRTCTSTYVPVAPVVSVEPIAATMIVQPPYYNLPPHLDLDKDVRVHKQVTKYFRRKTLSSWLYNDLSNLLGYFMVDSTGVSFIKTLGDYKEDVADKDNDDVLDQKVNYIAKYILTYDTMFRMLRKLVKEAGLHWYTLHKNEFYVKETVAKQLRKILREMVTNQTVSK